MRAIIDGLSYNTGKAKKLGEASSGFPGDFSRWIESLFRTDKGRFFLAGEGGPASSWREATGHNQYSGGSGLRSLTEAEAQDWAERYLSADEYAAIWTPEEA